MHPDQHDARADQYATVDQVQQQQFNANPKARAGWRASRANPHANNDQHDVHSGSDRSLLSKLTESFAAQLSQSQRVEEPLTPTSHAKAQFEATWAKAERAVSGDNGFADVLSPTSRSVKQFEDSMTRASLLEQ